MIRWLGYACLAIICGAILTVAGVLAWFIADRSPPVRVLEREVLTPTVRPGGKLVIRTTVDYVRNCKGHVDRILYDSHTHRHWLPDIDYERPPKLGTFTLTTEIDVPDDFQSGPAEYRAVPVFFCNPLQRYYWPIDRDDIIIPFTVESPQ